MDVADHVDHDRFVQSLNEAVRDLDVGALWTMRDAKGHWAETDIGSLIIGFMGGLHGLFALSIALASYFTDANF